MSSPVLVSQWINEVSMRFAHLSQPQARGLACYSVGIVLVDGCGLSRVSYSLANLLKQSPRSCRQRLREWRNEASAKQGTHRQEIEVSRCFAPLLQWVLSCLETQQQHVLLALDASSLSDRFVVLSASVLVRGCAIPVAWHIVPAGVKGSWKPIWLRLLEEVHEGVSPHTHTHPAASTFSHAHDAPLPQIHAKVRFTGKNCRGHIIGASFKIIGKLQATSTSLRSNFSFIHSCL